MQRMESKESNNSPNSKFKNLRKLNLSKTEDIFSKHSISVLKRNQLELRREQKVLLDQ